MKRITFLLLSIIISTHLFAQSAKEFKSLADALAEPENVESLSLNDKDIDVLPAKCSQFINLKEIDLESLDKLNFSKTMRLLSKLPRLKKIFISGCNITDDTVQIDGFVSLEEFSLYETGLKILPRQVQVMKNLRSLCVDKNPGINLSIAFERIKHLTKLTELQIGDCQLTAIPDNIIQLKHIQILWLDGNNIKEIPPPIKKMGALVKLRLFDNEINRIILKKGDLIKLTSIDLCYNKFDVFPIELSVLPQLRHVTIWGNKIKTIPPEIKNFRLIDSINMDDNELSTIPVEISALLTLRHLSLRNNKLISKSIENVYKIKGLWSLGLDDNKIDYISPAIKQLPNLKYLGLSNNPLTDLPEEIGDLKILDIIGLDNLPTLDWRHTFTLLQKIPKLRAVGIARMKIKKMPPEFEKLTQVKTFWINSNSFEADEWLRIRKALPNAKFVL